MRTVHWVASLESGDSRPAESLELSTCFGGRHEQRAVFRLESAVGQHFERTGKIHVALRHHHFHARVLKVGRPENRQALVRFVDPILLFDRHGREDLAVVRIDERDVAAETDARGVGVARGQRDRDWPEDAVRYVIRVADDAPIGVSHEARQRREAAEPQHDDVAFFARRDLKLWKRARAGELA